MWGRMLTRSFTNTDNSSQSRKTANSVLPKKRLSRLCFLGYRNWPKVFYWVYQMDFNRFVFMVEMLHPVEYAWSMLWRCFTTVFLPFWPRHHLSTGCPGISHLIPSDGPGGMGGWAHRPRQDHLTAVEVQPRERRLSVADCLSVFGIPDDWGQAPPSTRLCSKTRPPRPSTG